MVVANVIRNEMAKNTESGLKSKEGNTVSIKCQVFQTRAGLISTQTP